MLVPLFNAMIVCRKEKKATEEEHDDGIDDGFDDGLFLGVADVRFWCRRLTLSL